MCIPSPRNKIYFFLLSPCREQLIFTPKIMTLQPNSPVGNENLRRVSNSIPYGKYLHLSISAFLANWIAPNKELSNC